MIINAGIRRIVYLNAYPDDLSLELIAGAGLDCECFGEKNRE